MLQCAHASRKKKGKTPQIRYVSYCELALKIMKFQQEDSFKHNNCLEEILHYICKLVPNNIMGDILEDSYKVLLKEFCEAMQIKLLQYFIGSHFLKTYWKKFAAKVSFLVKLHSVISNKIKIACIDVSWITFSF